MNVFNALGHLVTATMFSVFVVHTPLDFGLVLFGSLLPDIDHRRSTLGRYNIFARFMKHRGRCHTIIGSFLLSVPFFLVGGINTFLMVLFGCMTHLFADKVYSLLPKKRKFQLKIW